MIEAFVSQLTKNTPLLGLDVGSKTIGLALSDTNRFIATGLETVKRTKFTKDLERLKDIIDVHKISGLVIGLPLNMDGSEGPRAQSTRTFGQNLAKQLNVPLIYHDERLSTMGAERVLLEADTSRAKRKEVIDKMAATLILQGFLDHMNNLKKT